jgi:site-specific recombinase XerD
MKRYAAKGIKSDYVFVNERGEPFGRMGIARKIERAGEAAGLSFSVHVHMLRHSTGYALAAKGMDTRRLAAGGFARKLQHQLLRIRSTGHFKPNGSE